MIKANKAQVIAINTALSKKGLMEDKKRIISDASGGRTESSRELSTEEAAGLIQFLNSSKEGSDAVKDKMIRKLVAMCYDLRWIKEKSHVGASGMVFKKDYSSLYEWVRKYGYLKKELKDYTAEELPKLLTQFELGPYAHNLKK